MRRRTYLNGEWHFSPDYDNRSPEQAIADCRWEKQTLRVPSSWRWMIDEQAVFQPYDMFGYPRTWNAAQSGVLGRTFAVQREGDKRVFLILKGVLQRSVTCVNDEPVLETQEGYLPLEIDVTDQVLDGPQNDLKVWCGSFERIATETGVKVLAPNGSWFARLARGIWQDVYLEYRPTTFIQHTFVNTSTRKQMVAVWVDLHSCCGFMGTVRVTIKDGDSIVKRMAPHDISLAAGETVQVVLEDAWTDAVTWSPAYPHLYTLQVALADEGEVIDAVETRFGFREVWLEDHKFILNGTRINLRGDAWHYQGFVQQTKQYALNWYQACKDTGINIVRLHAMPYPECYLEAADEAGMLVIDESAIYGSSKSTASDHPTFIHNCHQHLRSLVLRDRNHPSVVIWSMQNEMRWVDGRQGYKAAMTALTQTMKELDPTRPVSYDGDNRLVDPQDMEIISMHYNIDGTVAGWEKDKPLIFSEHGAWHYVSPQACSSLGGPKAYVSFDRCQEGIGLWEQLFNLYGRQEEVTGLTPFNMANYMMHTFPQQDIPLQWEDLSTPGVKPDVIRAHTLTINNGHVEGPLYRLNPSWPYVQASFKPVAIFPDEYNTAFYGGASLARRFSIYNDTEQAADVKLTYRLVADDGATMAEGEETFRHPPGERRTWSPTFTLPEVAQRSQLELYVDLYHGNELMDSLRQTYQVYPARVKDDPLDTRGKRVAYLGQRESYAVLSRVLDQIAWLEDGAESALDDVHLLIIGKDFDGNAEELQPKLAAFVSAGGVLLILEQTSFITGDVALSGRRYVAAFINDPAHPIFNGLTDEDLRFWGPENVHRASERGSGSFIVENAFDKPVQGNLKPLLECGEGSFGWGGLLWTPLLAYEIGSGRVILSQIEIVANFDHVPQAGLLLRNMLAYALTHEPTIQGTTGLIAEPGSSCEAFFQALGLDYRLVTDDVGGCSLVIVDPQTLGKESAARLRAFAENGGRVLVLPLEAHHAPRLKPLVGTEVSMEETSVYQLQPCAHELTRGISLHDLFHIERVSYVRGQVENTVICQNAIEVAAGEPLLESVHNPWYEYFVAGLNQEYRKVAIATMVAERSFQPACYGMVIDVDQGAVVLSQIKLLGDNEKVQRVYARLLGNMGAAIDSRLLSYVKGTLDYGIQSFMALAYERRNAYDEVEAYFSDPNFVLNNLGEGAYGWMKRVEKAQDWVTIPDSAGKTFFLTVFVESDINRDPAKRATGELPDSSIVPDVEISTNASLKLFVNGRCYVDYAHDGEGVAEMTIDDVVLEQGVNRVLLVCRGGTKDVRFNLRFKDKFDQPVKGLSYRLTLD